MDALPYRGRVYANAVMCLLHFIDFFLLLPIPPTALLVISSCLTLGRIKLNDADREARPVEMRNGAGGLERKLWFQTSGLADFL